MEETRKYPEQITWTTLWKIFKYRWWIILIAFMVATTAAGAVIYTTHKEEYTATAKLLSFHVMSMDPSDGSVEGDAEAAYAYSLIMLQYTQIGQQLVDAYREIMMTDEVLNRVINTYNAYPRDEAFGAKLNLTKGSLKSMASISSTDSEMVFKLSITIEERPYDAELLANIWSTEFCEYVKELMGGQRLVQSIDLPRIRASETETTPAVDGAATYTNPISIPLILLIGLAAAVLVYAVFLIRYISNDKINTAADVKEILGLNLLGAIPVQPHMSNVKWTVHGENKADTVEFKK